MAASLSQSLRPSPRHHWRLRFSGQRPSLPLATATLLNWSSHPQRTLCQALCRTASPKASPSTRCVWRHMTAPDSLPSQPHPGPTCVHLPPPCAGLPPGPGPGRSPNLKAGASIGVCQAICPPMNEHVHPTMLLSCLGMLGIMFWMGYIYYG